MQNSLDYKITGILKEYSGSDKRLNQKEILGLLMSEYGEKTDRKTLRNTLIRLKNNEKRIKCTERKRKNGVSGWYIEDVFSDREKEMIAESIVKNVNIPENDCKGLINKLEEISNGFESEYGWVNFAGRRRTKYRSCREKLRKIREAIKERMMLTFSVIVYEKKGRLRLRRDSAGRVREYLVRPSAVICADGSYKLLGAIGDTDFYAYFTVENMYALEVTDIRAIGEEKPGTLYLPESKAEAIRPKTGEKIKVTVLARQNALEEIYDSYGQSAEITREKGDVTVIKIETEPDAFERWAMRLGSDIEIIEPVKMRRSISAKLREMLLMYTSEK